jgi:hypothetical protein
MNVTPGRPEQDLHQLVKQKNAPAAGRTGNVHAFLRMQLPGSW